MFHPRQSSLFATISQLSKKCLAQWLSGLLRHPLIVGGLISFWLVINTLIDGATFSNLISSGDFPETALAALIFSGLIIAVAYSVIHVARHIMTVFRRDE